VSSANVILRGADLALTAERAPGAPVATYVSRCLLCRAESGLVDYDLKPVAVWSIEHARYHGRDHGQFLVTSQQHWRVGPEPVAVAVSTARPPASHARPREAAALRLPLAALAAFLVCCVYVLLSAAR
jgi:hypothetical protein